MNHNPTLRLALWCALPACLSGALQGDGVIWHTDAWVATLATGELEREIHQASGFRLVTDRDYIRPGERYFEGLLIVDPVAEFTQDFAEDRPLWWHLELFDTRSVNSLLESTHPASADPTAVWVDLRKHGARQYRLRVSLLDAARPNNGHPPPLGDAAMLGSLEIMLQSQSADPSPQDLIPLNVDWPKPDQSPPSTVIAFGIPFAPGTLWDEYTVGMVDENGRPVPASVEVAARRAPQGAVRWLRVHALLRPDQPVFVSLTGPPAIQPPDPIRIHETGDGFTVTVADYAYRLSRRNSPISEIRQGDKVLASANGSRGLFVVDQEGRLGRALQADIAVEAEGPLATSFRFEGPYTTEGGEELARHITRIEFFAGQPEAVITHTLILSRDTRKVWFSEIGWEMYVMPGDAPHAIFATAADDPARFSEYLFKDNSATLSMVQLDYPQFGGGTAAYEIASSDGEKNTSRNVLKTGTEMGDWGVLRGDSGGLLMLCRESARQHPKDICIRANHMSMTLFSAKTGQKLDFRPEALMERWNRGGRVPEKDRDEILNTATNARGWSKTHQLVFRPIAPGDSIEAVVATACQYVQPVYASVDPQWIYQSGVLGPLYPYDPDRFPVEEAFIKDSISAYIERGHRRDQQYGFVDYFAGPHYGGPLGDVRFRTTYGVRMAPWLLYARSGDRQLREFAQGTNRKYGDSYHLHYSDDADRVAGLYAFTSDRGVKGRYPYYWGTHDSGYGGGGPNSLNQYLWDYYLTGYRRSGDQVANYARGMQDFWQPGKPSYYILKKLRNLVLAYSYEWDPDLRPIIEDYMAQLYDPQAGVSIRQGALTGFSTRKTEEDTLGLLEAANLLGDSRLIEISDKLATYNWMQSLGQSPSVHRFDKGGIAWHKWTQDADPSIATEIWCAVRQGVADSPIAGVSAQNFRQIGLPYALAVIAESNAVNKVPSSWAAYNAFGNAAEIIIYKKQDQKISLFARGENMAIAETGATAQSRLHHIWQQSNSALAVLPIDSDEGIYSLSDASNQSVFAVADKRVPLVVHAPGLWRPEPRNQNSRIPVFFKLPQNASAEAAIFFEGPTRLYDPDGKPYMQGNEFSGWVTLPSDQPGLWSFRADRFNFVQVRDLPPFFAFDDPAFYFSPDIPQIDYTPRPTRRTAPDQSGFIPLSEAVDGHQAFYLDAPSRLLLADSACDLNGNVNTLLPYESGTIEFWVKPYWDTFELFPVGTREFLKITTEDGRDWHLSYTVNDHTREWPASGQWRSHVFDAEIWCDQGRAVCLRRGIVQASEWIHVALVWGGEPHTDRQGQREVFRVKLFINGKEGEHWSNFRDNTGPQSRPVELILGAGMPAAFHNFVISRKQKYRNDFEPPQLLAKPVVDGDTLAWFSFDGTLEAVSADTLDRGVVKWELMK